MLHKLLIITNMILRLAAILQLAILSVNYLYSMVDSPVTSYIAKPFRLLDYIQVANIAYTIKEDNLSQNLNVEYPVAVKSSIANKASHISNKTLNLGLFLEIYHYYITYKYDYPDERLSTSLKNKEKRYPLWHYYKLQADDLRIIAISTPSIARHYHTLSPTSDTEEDNVKSKYFHIDGICYRKTGSYYKFRIYILQEFLFFLFYEGNSKSFSELIHDGSMLPYFLNWRDPLHHIERGRRRVITPKTRTKRNPKIHCKFDINLIKRPNVVFAHYELRAEDDSSEKSEENTIIKMLEELNSPGSGEDTIVETSDEINSPCTDEDTATDKSGEINSKD